MLDKNLLEKIMLCFIALYVALIAFEIWWSFRAGKRVYTLREGLTSLSTGLFHKAMTSLIPLAAQLYLLNLAYSHSIFRWNAGAGHFLAAFLLTDLMYYAHHRANHEWEFFWSMHQAHHSSLELNLLTGTRVSWLTPFFAPLFLCPLAFLGINPEYILVSLVLVFYGQWWCHSVFVPKLGFLEKILNTPSSHRVHHSPLEEHAFANYGGVLIIWDRLFGSYKPETQEITTFGTGDGFVGHNPFVVNFRGLYFFGKKQLQTMSGVEESDGAPVV